MRKMLALRERNWFFVAVLYQTIIAIATDSSTDTVQVSYSAQSSPSEIEYDQYNWLYVNITDNSATEVELWNKVLLRLSNMMAPRSKVGAARLRRKRLVFGKDNRIHVRTAREAQLYPFSTVVMLSTGCTGTLVGTQHVLTAAHCIHDGSKFLKAVKKKHLRIGKVAPIIHSKHQSSLLYP